MERAFPVNHVVTVATGQDTPRAADILDNAGSAQRLRAEVVTQHQVAIAGPCRAGMG